MTRHLPVALAAALLGVAACAPETTDPQLTDPPEVDADRDAATEEDPLDGLTDDDADDPTDDDPTAADDATAPDDTATEDDAADEQAATEVDGLTFTACEADELSVEYPQEWTAYEGGEIPACRAFHPEPIDDLTTQELGLAARIMIDPVDFEEAAEQPFGEELTREQLTVDGRDALMVERRSDGGAMLPEGEKSTSYFVDLGDQALILMTTTVGESDYEQDRQVLTRMVESLEIHG